MNISTNGEMHVGKVERMEENYLAILTILHQDRRTVISLDNTCNRVARSSLQTQLNLHSNAFSPLNPIHN